MADPIDHFAADLLIQHIREENESSIEILLSDSALFPSISSEAELLHQFMLEATAKANPNIFRVLFHRVTDLKFFSTYLNVACETGNLKAVKLALTEGSNNSWLTEEDVKQAIFIAMKNKREDVVTFLLEHTALDMAVMNKVNTSETDPHPLVMAARIGDTGWLEFLINRGMEVDLSTSYIEEIQIHTVTPIQEACACGQLQSVQLLASMGADLNQRNEENQHLLHLASGGSHVDVLQWLIDQGADVNVSGAQEMSPLQYAGLCHQTAAARVLLENGASVNFQTRHSLNAFIMFHSALDSNQLGAELEIQTSLFDAVHELQGSGDSGTQIDFAQQKDAIENPVGFSALHLAAFDPSPTDEEDSVVDVLLQNGASMDSVTVFGTTPLHVAAAVGSLNTVQKLCQNGAKLDVFDAWGCTPLLLALCIGHIDVARFVVKSGASFSLASKELLQQQNELSNLLENSLYSDLMVIQNETSISRVVIENAHFISEFKPNLYKFNEAAVEQWESFRSLAILAGCEKKTSEEILRTIRMMKRLLKKEDMQLVLSEVEAPIKEKQDVLLLTELCRQCIRQAVKHGEDGSVINANIERLPVPNTIKGYLNFASD